MFLKNKRHYFYNDIYKLISNYKIIFLVYIFIATLSSVLKYNIGTRAYNNYLIFKSVYFNTINSDNLYSLYPDLFFDSNHYGIFFSLIIAPFAILPDWLGMILWNIANTIVFLFAIYKLPFSDKKKSIFAWFCLQEFITSVTSFQFNIALTGLIILSYLYILERKETNSAISILIGTFVKIYGVVGLSSFFFVKNKSKFIISLIFVGIIFLVLPMVLSTPNFGIESYVDWYNSITEKNNLNQELYTRQDFSIMGIVRRLLGKSDISNLYFIVPGFILFMLPYIRIKQYKNISYQLMILASTLLFVVLFSSSSESPTYIIAVAGVVIWFLIQEKSSKLDKFLFLFVIILTCFSFSDLFPRYLKENYILKYSLKALPCILVWFKVIYELLFKDFERDYNLN